MASSGDLLAVAVASRPHLSAVKHPTRLFAPGNGTRLVSRRLVPGSEALLFMFVACRPDSPGTENPAGSRAARNRARSGGKTLEGFRARRILKRHC